MAKPVKADDFRDDQTGDTGEPPEKKGRRAKLASQGGIDPDAVKNFSDRLTQLHDDLEETAGAIKADIKEVYEEAREAGIKPKLLRMAFKAARDTKKRNAKIDKMDADEKIELELIERALGDFADTPLGQAATGKAGAEIGATAGTA